MNLFLKILGSIGLVVLIYNIYTVIRNRFGRKSKMKIDQNQEAGNKVNARVQETRRIWIRGSLSFYRSLGFFADKHLLSDEELAEKLEEEISAEWGSDIICTPKDILGDLNLLQLDTKRVWWADLEADVCRENSIYEETLCQWATISRQCFSPTAITETWQGEEGPVIVRFTMNGLQYEVHPRYCSDFIDLAIVEDLNSIIAESGYRFEVYDHDDQMAFVVVLNADEKAQLQQQRHWKFAELR